MMIEVYFQNVSVSSRSITTALYTFEWWLRFADALLPGRNTQLGNQEARGRPRNDHVTSLLSADLSSPQPQARSRTRVIATAERLQHGLPEATPTACLKVICTTNDHFFTCPALSSRITLQRFCLSRFVPQPPAEMTPFDRIGSALSRLLAHRLPRTCCHMPLETPVAVGRHHTGSVSRTTVYDDRNFCTATGAKAVETKSEHVGSGSGSEYFRQHEISCAGRAEGQGTATAKVNRSLPVPQTIVIPSIRPWL
ncbi:hypothetical protein J6590_037378 [Homalodisca vitripennis]|nr:hypothetical protein J6590_037378 [Homalodisca vitripennis]